MSCPRLTAFWAFALVSTAMVPSTKPYHMATAWIEPSWLSVHMVIGPALMEECVDLLVGHLDQVPLLDAVAHLLVGPAG